jgi:hypothetical protein
MRGDVVVINPDLFGNFSIHCTPEDKEAHGQGAASVSKYIYMAQRAVFERERYGGDQRR